MIKIPIIIGLLLALVSCETQNVIIITPHIWVCEEGQTQTLLLDLVSQDLWEKPGIVNIAMTSRSDTSESYTYPILIQTSDNGFQRVDFQLMESIPAGLYDVNVTLSINGEFEFNGSLPSVTCRNREKGIFIITDKPVYKDSEKVRMRIVAIDDNLLPIEGQIASIYIKDPNQNRVQQFLDVKFENGIIDGLQFQLTERPIYGSWEIKVTSGDFEKSINFEVKEYVLPKFDFTVDLPSYVLRSSKVVKGRIEAKYTYGKQLDGEAIIRLENQYYNQTSYTLENMVQHTSRTTFNKGKTDFEVPFSIENNFFGFKLNITVIDKYSQENSSKEFSLNIIQNEFEVRMDSYSFTPNKTNTIKITSIQPDQKPYSLKKLDLNITQRLSDYVTIFETKIVSLTSDINGQIVFDLFVGPNVTSIPITISPQSDPTQSVFVYLWMNTFDSVPSINDNNQLGSTLGIESKTSDLKIGDTLDLLITRSDPLSTKSCLQAKYFIIAKFDIFVESVIELCDQTTVSIDLDSKYAPDSKFVVYYLDPDTKNVSVASYSINIPNYFRNKLNIKFGYNITEPGQEVQIELNSKENSIVSICIIDKSVELLGPTNEVTVDSINGLVNSLALNGYYPPDPTSRPFNSFMYYPIGRWARSKALEALNSEGLIVSSDVEDLKANYSTLFRGKKAFDGPWYPMASGGIEFDSLNAGNNVVAFGDDVQRNPAKKEDSVQARSDFKETWIWQTIQMENETQSIYSKIPDTITSWVASGFSVNREYGLAVANKTQITTFKNFFVSMILPASLVRGEILHLQVVVFNYFDQNLTDVRVILSKTGDFKESAGNSFENIDEDLESTIPLIEAQSAQTVEFLISPVNLGLLPLTVKAVSSQAGDGETRRLKVKAEGIPQTFTSALLVETSDDNSLTHDFPISLPANKVDGSEFCSIQVIGDLLGPSLNNLNRLITKPYGCGEQNMITLTPNIYALNYLYAIADPETSNISNLNKFIIDAKQNIISGYQNQLKYVLDDGSFSAFGKSDQNGSTWLTSFVVKSFAQARKYAPQIEEKVILKASKFLAGKQAQNGSFVENGRVIHKDMQGGVESDLTITAYVTIALLESQLMDDEVQTAIEKSLGYLRNQATNVQDVYALGLVTYALNLGGSLDDSDEKGDQVFELFQSKLVKNPDGTGFWSRTPGGPESSSDIELSSYGLLLNLLHNDISTSLAIVRYLVGKSNSLGSYSNSQNTVLALQALSQFGIKTSSRGDNSNSQVEMNVDLVDSDGESISGKTFTTNQVNSMVLQSWDLPTCDAKVRLSAEGNGNALFQLVVSYNLPKVPVTPLFRLTQSATKDLQNALNVRTCVTYNKDSSPSKDPSTGMTLIESTLLSGFEADKQELNKLVQSRNVEYLKLIEIKDQNVIFYLDQLDDSREICIDWKMYKQTDVDNLQAAPVKVYDYYQSDLEFTTLFNPQ